LFENCRPATIFWRIGPLRIDPVQSPPWWAVTHVREEASKPGEFPVPMPPSFANGHASSAIAAIGGVVWVMAPIDHASPCPIERVLAIVSRLTGWTHARGVTSAPKAHVVRLA
jgi:hypothetical protein